MAHPSSNSDEMEVGGKQVVKLSEAYQLNTSQCAEVALWMYHNWEKAMQPPLFVWKSFPEWLDDVVNTTSTVVGTDNG